MCRSDNMSEDDIVVKLTSTGLYNLTRYSFPTQVEEVLRKFAKLLWNEGELRRLIVRHEAIKYLKSVRAARPAQLIDAALKLEKRAQMSTEKGHEETKPARK